MGKSLTGKELGQGITQRKDGRYQARFTNRFGKRQTIYAKTLNEIRQKLRSEQYEDEKKLNVVSSDMTLDEWFDVWMDTSDRIAKEHEKFKPLTPHTLRHTFATRCIERGMNPKTVQVILGHSSVNITMNLYCHVTEDTLISEMSKFEAEESEKGVNRQIGVKVV